MKFKLGIALISIILTLSLLAPLFSPYSYAEIQLTAKNLSPSLKHWFGTDELGRDIFTRVWYGGRISIFIGISAACIDLVIGVLWGGISAYSSGWVDRIMMRLADILYALPYMLVVIAFAVVLEPGIISLLIAMTFIGWITMARIVRGQILQLSTMPYVMAAKAMGASYFRILFRHLIPNALGPIVVTLTLTIPSAIFVEAFLSFLGIGLPPPIASWGTMASDGLPAMMYYPWRLFFPSAAIFITMLSFNLIGDALRDKIDPRFNKVLNV